MNVASLGKIIPGWGQTEDFIAPWFATLEAKINEHASYARIQPQYAADWP